MKVQDFGLGPQLDTRSVPDNYWPSVLEVDARQTIDMLIKDRFVPFAMTESLELQALASGRPEIILVSGGLVDAICRFCARLVGAGMFVAFGTAEPDWKPTIQRSMTPIRELLRDEPFRWLPAFVPWIDDDERVGLFGFLVITIHRFVVLHELGHIVFGHSERDGEISPVVDGKLQDEANRQAAILSQARELAADTYAINMLHRIFEAEYERPGLDPLRQLLKDKLLGTKRERLRMMLFAAFAIFQILDRRNWTLRGAMKATHPPAPARVKSAFATVLEMKLKGVTEAELEQDIRLAHELSHAIVSVGFDSYPDLEWLARTDDPEYNGFMLEVVEALPGQMRTKLARRNEPVR